ncbi:MAG: orotidine-5'-phosphate decarboxylase [Desulfovibrio sp.]|nr:orotidine-5'-phosphate decarboxylase [Desulfovibrio sp.]
MAELILALDLPDRTKALNMLDKLGNDLKWCKIGMELFTRYGPALVEEIKNRGLSVFLDLKFYDIPHTVGRAIASAKAIGVDIVTLHCQGGVRMLAQAVEEVAGEKKEKQPRPLLFGVTVLTSFAQGEMPGISLTPETFAMNLAQIAAQTGLDGIVCSAKEVEAIKKTYPELLCLCPGIRPSWAQKEDQRRIATPKEAINKGADYLVIGRPILEAQDPFSALRTILEEMA